LIKQRIKKFWQEIEKSEKKPTAFLVTNPKNIFYLTHFKGGGILLCSTEENYLITDSRYTEQAHLEARDCQIIVQEMKQSDAQTESFRKLIAELKIKEIGFESDSLQVSTYLKYQTCMPRLKLIPFQNIIETIRMIKDSHEIELMKKSAQIAANSFIKTLYSLKTGVSELTVSARLSYDMRKNGAQKEAFDLIVTSGKRGTLIHGSPSNKKIREGEFIIIDFGCIFEMYHSDCTRSFILGDSNKEQKKIFDIVKKTQIETLQQVKAGKRCGELDDFARNMIEKSGYGNYFSHSLGHGVGLDIHELPRLSPNAQTVLQPGMVVTVEPGIYISNIGGVRIEDTVVVTEKGCQILTPLPKVLSGFTYRKQDFNDIIIA